MNPTHRRAAVLTATAVLAAPLLMAQDPDVPVVRPPQPVRQVVDDAKNGARTIEEETLELEKAQLAEGDVDAAKVVGPPPIGSDLAFHMAPTLGFEPRRIAPGASGVARLVLSMQRDSVLAVGTHLEIVCPTTEQARFGPWALAEPQIGSSAGAFRGRPVYENYALVEMPVTVTAGTAHGKYPIRMMVVADITDARTGTTTRRAQAQAVGELVVGPPLPVPPAAGVEQAAPARPAAAVAVPVDDGEVALPVEAAGAPVGAEVAAARSGGAAPTDAGRLPSLPSADPGTGAGGWLAIGGAGVLVLILALLLATRRR